MKRLAAALALLIILACSFPSGPARGEEKSRLPGPFEIGEADAKRLAALGTMARNDAVEAALTLLEEGSPFVGRYNLITGAQVEPVFPYGVPYLFGGQASSHVFAKKPEYTLQKAWQNSKVYYQAGKTYLYGFDCVGFMQWVWKKAGRGELPSVAHLLRSDDHHVFSSTSRNRAMPAAWPLVAQQLQPGDLLVLKHPGTHLALYIGTLRQFGYTEAEVPLLRNYLDWPLVIHAAGSAAIADRFAYLIKNGPRKYRLATVTDGGVGVALVGPKAAQAPGHVFQQNQDTYYFTLPDNTWLPILTWGRSVTAYCWYRH